MTTKGLRLSRRIVHVVATLLCICSTSISQTAPAADRASDRTKISALITSWEQAWNNHDMTGFSNLFHQHGIWVLWTGQVWKGRGVIEEGHAAVHKTVYKNRYPGQGLALRNR